MRTRSIRAAAATAAMAVLFGLLSVPPALAAASEPDAAAEPATALDDGCYLLRVTTTGTTAGAENYVERASVGYGTRGSADDAEPIAFEATQLGRYRLYDTEGSVLYQSALGYVWAGSSYGKEADWTITRSGEAFTITGTASGDIIGSRSGKLTTSSASFSLEPAEGCSQPYEPDTALVSAGTDPTVNADGTLNGVIDAHAHLVSSSAFGGELICGDPFSAGGIEQALAGCASHSVGAGALFEAVIGGADLLGGDDGWPTFDQWPSPTALLHQQAYYKGLERAWQGGLSTINTLLVGNRVICELYPSRVTSCDEMEQIRVQAEVLRDMQDYIDAQSGGPGLGWFRIAETPAQVREIVADGKLAVTIGVEMSEMFGCRVIDEVAQCDEADIDAGLDEFAALGISGLYPVHKFDNAFGGTRFDAGTTGIALNLGNYLSTGSWWQAERCEGPADNEQALVNDDIAAFLDEYAEAIDGTDADLPAGTVFPVYPSGGLCNTRTLTDLGVHLIEQMMQRGMIINVDHMGVRTAEAVLDIVEEAGYTGVAAVHSWSDPEINGRIAKLGGFIASYAYSSGHLESDGSDTDFIGDWRHNVEAAEGAVTAYGYGSDTNGLGNQPQARLTAATDPLEYPFTAINGAVLDRQSFGERTFDLNTDGVAQYGLYADWLADVLDQAGADRAVLEAQLLAGVEAYVQMWEAARAWND